MRLIDERQDGDGGIARHLRRRAAEECASGASQPPTANEDEGCLAILGGLQDLLPWFPHAEHRRDGNDASLRRSGGAKGGLRCSLQVHSHFFETLVPDGVGRGRELVGVHQHDVRSDLPREAYRRIEGGGGRIAEVGRHENSTNGPHDDARPLSKERSNAHPCSPAMVTGEL